MKYKLLTILFTLCILLVTGCGREVYIKEVNGFQVVDIPQAENHTTIVGTVYETDDQYAYVVNIFDYDDTIAVEVEDFEVEDVVLVEFDGDNIHDVKLNNLNVAGLVKGQKVAKSNK